MTELLAWARSRWPGRTVRLTLMPVGALGMVPWHAARVPAAPDAVRPGAAYACDSAVISYCAAARQLVDVAARPRLPLDRSPLLLMDPDGSSSMRTETELIRSLYYPAALVLGGEPGRPATPAQVVPLLPGRGPVTPALVHVNCHADSGASSADSKLVLNERANLELTVADLLGGTLDRAPDTPGGLVVLADCASDLTRGDHDEALTLSTAFLAAGATSVVGSRWLITDDGRTALLMCLFHHFLTGRGRAEAPEAEGSPVDALRAAQLWLLDPARVVPDALRDLAASAVGRRGDRPLDELEVWSAFSHHGH